MIHPAIRDALATVVPLFRAPYLQGIDISGYQPVIRWGEVVAADQRFAIIKATEGNGYESEAFDMHWSNSESVAADRFIAAGERLPYDANGRPLYLFRSPYHFAKPYRPDGRMSDPIAEAEWFVSRVADVDGFRLGTLPPLLDLEQKRPKGGILSASARALMVNWALKWLERVEQLTARVPWLYLGYWHWRNYLGRYVGRLGRYPLHLAAYVPERYQAPRGQKAELPDAWPDGFTCWQWTGKGKVPGVYREDGKTLANCDRNRFNGSELALMRHAGLPLLQRRLAA